jgi:hemerythrin superfamily protein
MDKQFQIRDQKAFEGDAIMAADDIVDLILEDHKAIKKLLEVLKDENLERSEKEECLEEFIPLLMQHAKSEEESLYAKMKSYETLRMHSFAGITEHALAEEMVQKINASPDDDEWKAKVKILAESVEHHITEEEDEVLPEVERQMDVMARKCIGDEYSALKLDYSLLLMKPHRGPDWEGVIE